MKLRLLTLALGMAAVLSGSAVSVDQVFLPVRSLRGDVNLRRCQAIDAAAWLGDARESPFYRFSCSFSARTNETLRIDVSADERFVLFLDGAAVARGPHRGQVRHWYYQSYELKGLEPGRHEMSAVVTKLGDNAPIAQLSHRGGSFILKAHGGYDADLTTGCGRWTVAPLDQTTAVSDDGQSGTYGVGKGFLVSGTSVFDERPPASAYRPAGVVRKPLKDQFYGIIAPGWMLFPTERPDTTYAVCSPGTVRAVRADDVAANGYAAADAASPWVKSFNDLLADGRALTVPTGVAWRVLWDLGDYWCAYPELVADGGKGAEVRWGWAESLRDAKGRKGNRDAFLGKNARQALNDVFRSDGRSQGRFAVPWWRCGRWCELTIRTRDEPLTLRALRLGECRYPLAVESAFSSDDRSLEPILSICRRGMEMCANEMLFDCPYYEQQMYPGDTRIQLLILSALTRDTRMTRFAMSVYDYDRREDGRVAMNFPTRGTQESATYTMCWVMMFRDYLYWHRDADFLKAHLPGVRNALDGLALYENADGLLEDLPGWSFMDWVPGWANGVAPNGQLHEGISAANNLLYHLAMKGQADVEEALGHPHQAAALREKASRLAETIVRRFWRDGRGLLADTETGDRFSEHAQCLALLGDVLDDAKARTAFGRLVRDGDLARVSAYFAHYLFETYEKFGRADLVLKRFDTWKDFLTHGAKTPFETNEIESRSDCHAWSACPIYHVHAGIAGVRPSSPFFRTVRIAPQFGALRHLRARTPHPDGFVETDLSVEGNRLTGTVILPPGLTGELVWKGATMPLKDGAQAVDLKASEE